MEQYLISKTNMKLYKTIDINTWERKNHYLFFKDYANPFYNICTNIDVTTVLDFTKKNNLSFFLSILFLSSKAVNNVKELRYRIVDDNVLAYNIIHPFSTVFNDDKTFSFCPFTYYNEFATFHKKGNESITEISKIKDRLEAKEYRLDVIHYTSIPWISITGMTHPRKTFRGDSIPKIVFGKYFNDGNTIKMPICIEVNHALVDGFHISEYLELLQEYILNAKVYL